MNWFFLRGLIRESGHWGGFLTRLETALPSARAIALEIPGNGRRFREKSPLTVGSMAEAAREEFLAQRSGHDYLFALSLGGMIGLEWMRRWPEDFCGVVLVNTSVRGLSPLSDRLRPVNYIRILRMLLSRDQGAVEQNILEMTSSKSKDFSHLAREWVKIAKAHPVNSANALRQLVAAARFRPGQERPTLPTLVLNGAQDRLVNPACSAALAKAWGLRLEVHPTAGHDLTLDEPEWVLAELAKFTGIVAR